MRYRVKTKEEFQHEGRWNSAKDCPIGWSSSGAMNYLLGQGLPEMYNDACKKSKIIVVKGLDGTSWSLQSKDYCIYGESLITNIPVPDSNKVFDLQKLATEIDKIFQVNLNIAAEKHSAISKAALDLAETQMSEYLAKVKDTFSNIKTELLAEVSKGRTTINLSPVQAISVQHLDHPKFEAVVKSLQLYHKAMLVGPAGSGKTYMVLEIANRMNLPFYKYSCSRDSSVHDLIGYKQPKSETYLETTFLNAYEHGGIFLVDEYDAMSGDMSLFFNGVADGSKFISIPHRDEKPIAQRHKDFYLIMCGNTWGKGSIEYTGRDFQDMALMDRFRLCRHYIGYNIALEKSFMNAEYEFASRLRFCMEKTGSYLSTRNIEDIALLLKTQVSKKDIVEMLVHDLDPGAQTIIRQEMIGRS